jgi:hypothetical protein
LFELRRPAHLATRDQQDVVAQSAGFQIFRERGHGVVEHRADVTHAFFHTRVDPGDAAHVPDETRTHHHETATALA